MKVFAISLPRSDKRHAYIKSHLGRRTKFAWQTVGIDGAELRKQSISWPHNAALSTGEVGCALSHAEAYRRIVVEGLEAGLVVEDDVVLPKNFDELVSNLLPLLRPGEVISLYSPSWAANAGLTRANSTKVGKYDLLLPMTADSVIHAVAILIHVDAARRIAAANVPAQFKADDFNEMYRLGLVKYLRVVYPFPCSYTTFPSTIGYQQSWIARIVARFLNAVWPFSALLRLNRRKKESLKIKNTKLYQVPSPLVAPNPRYEE